MYFNPTCLHVCKCLLTANIAIRVYWKFYPFLFFFLLREVGALMITRATCTGLFEGKTSLLRVPLPGARFMHELEWIGRLKYICLMSGGLPSYCQRIGSMRCGFPSLGMRRSGHYLQGLGLWEHHCSQQDIDDYGSRFRCSRDSTRDKILPANYLTDGGNDFSLQRLAGRIHQS